METDVDRRMKGSTKFAIFAAVFVLFFVAFSVIKTRVAVSWEEAEQYIEVVDYEDYFLIKVKHTAAVLYASNDSPFGGNGDDFYVQLRISILDRLLGRVTDNPVPTRVVKADPVGGVYKTPRVWYTDDLNSPDNGENHEVIMQQGE